MKPMLKEWLEMTKYVNQPKQEKLYVEAILNRLSDDVKFKDLVKSKEWIALGQGHEFKPCTPGNQMTSFLHRIDVENEEYKKLNEELEGAMTKTKPSTIAPVVKPKNNSKAIRDLVNAVSNEEELKNILARALDIMEVMIDGFEDSTLIDDIKDAIAVN